MHKGLSTEYKKRRIGTWVVYTHRDYPMVFSENENPETWFDQVRGPFERVDSSAGTKVAKCWARFGKKSYDLYFKQYLNRSVTDWFKNMVRPGRAIRALLGSARLWESGLKAPRILAICEKKYGPVLVREFSITFEVTGAKDVYWWVNERPGELSAFAVALGDAVGRMHQANLCHGDLRPGNVLARAAGNSYEFIFIDNERTVQYNQLPWKMRKKNLVQLNMLWKEDVKITDRMRFFKQYLKHNPSVAADCKQLALEVAAKTARRLEHVAKRSS